MRSSINRDRSQQSVSQKRVRLQVPSSARSSNKKARLEARARASSQSLTGNGSVQDASDSIAHAVEEVDTDTLDEVLMAIDMRNKDTIGCAYFVAVEETLYMLNDIKYGGIEVIEKLMQYIEPTVVLISSRVDESVEEHLKAGVDVGDETNNHIHPPYALEVRPTHEFGYDSAIRKLTNLDLEIFRQSQATFLVPGDDDISQSYGKQLNSGLSNAQGNVLQLSSAIDLESRLSTSCIGATLNYIEKRRAVVHLPGDQGGDETLKVTYLEMFGLAGVMTLSSDALISMQVVQDDFHPHAHNQGPTNAASGSKQGLSVFGLFQNLARTPQGKHLLRKYFLRPSLDLQVLNARHEAIIILSHPDNELLLQSLVKSLKNITNIRTTVQGLKRGISNGISKDGGMRSSVWVRLRSFAYYAIIIEKDIGDLKHAESLELRAKIAESFNRRALGIIGRAIIDVIDFGESQMAHRTVVLRGVDANLDEMKRQYDGLEDMLNHVSKEIGQTIPQELATSLNVVFFPQIGFLIAMPVDPITESAYYQDPTWEQSFYTAERTYFKDFRMIEMDNTIGDIYADICDREIEIVHDLAQRVLEYGDALTRISDVCAELDCLTALTQGAKMYNLVRPTMTDENVIDIEGGWHLLQALVVPSCIANDLNVHGGSGDVNVSQVSGFPNEASKGSRPNIMLLTGPNYSGKSVYLKQNAIIVYLAHVGSFIPATQATIGITDQILTRVTTRETVSRMQSAFLIDLQQVSSALYTMTRQTLLVIDEFGKGTNTADGVGLMCGLLTYLLELGDNRPKVLVATHLHEMFEGNYIKEHPDLFLANMEIRMDRQAANLEDQITYLYNLLPGRSVSSFGTVCAAMNGIDEVTVARAEYLLVQHARGLDLGDLCCGIDGKDKKEVKAAEEIARVLLLVDLVDEELDLGYWLSESLGRASPTNSPSTLNNLPVHPRESQTSTSLQSDYSTEIGSE